MQSTSVLPCPVCCYPPIPNRFSSYTNLRLSRNNHRRSLPFIPNPTHSSSKSCVLSLSGTSSCSREQEEERKKHNSYADHNHTFLERLYSSIDPSDASEQTLKAPNQEDTEETSEGFSLNMWWADLRAALGQRINVEGIVSSVAVVARDRHLALPHVAVPDIRHIDWAELKRNGFQGVVFDKDNTITVPYSLTLWSPLGSSFERCKSAFGSNIAVFSNSAGLHEYDPDGKKARALERAIGIKVIRHRVKKPAGTAEDIEKHFGCESSQLIMVGDRPFTDVVYGNRNGFFTILTEPLSLTEEPFIVKQVRKLEVAVVNRWCRRGMKPKSHRLLHDPLQCVEDPISPPL